jgi:hypothetical protein
MAMEMNQPLPDLGENPTDAEIQQFAAQAIVEAEEASYQRLKQEAPHLLQEQHDIRKGFEERLLLRWGEALSLYDLYLLVTTQIGQDVNQEGREEAIDQQDFVFEALIRIHGRACLIASEIRALMLAGHASGAQARWRTLHELSVVAYFIKEHGNDVAERYMLHEVIKTAKTADEYDQLATKMGYPAQDPAERRRLLDARDKLVQRYGPIYKKDYGWAANVLRGNVSFTAIEASVNMRHWRRAFMSASDSVHAGFKGMTSDIGQIGRAEYPNFILSGPSNAGLIEPADQAMLALQNCITALLTHQPTPERMIMLAVLERVREDALGAFIQAYETLERDEARFAESGEEPRYE